MNSKYLPNHEGPPKKKRCSDCPIPSLKRVRIYVDLDIGHYEPRILSSHDDEDGTRHIVLDGSYLALLVDPT